jgi:hypothetical protein
VGKREAKNLDIVVEAKENRNILRKSWLFWGTAGRDDLSDRIAGI